LYHVIIVPIGNAGDVGVKVNPLSPLIFASVMPAVPVGIVHAEATVVSLQLVEEAAFKGAVAVA
jgi:hypothetical protein